MLTLYTHPMSPCAQKVRILLSEKNLEWKAQHVDLPQKENLRPEYLKLNPLGVVPTLVDGGKVVIESSIICEYIDDAYPDPGFKPANPHAVARMRLWMKHIDNKLHPSCGAIQWPMIMRPAMMEKTEAEREALLAQIPEKPRRERQRRLIELGLEAPDVKDGLKTYRKTIQDMEADLAENSWLVGNAISLGDICMAPYFQTLIQFGWTKLYEDCPHVMAWVDKIQARPSFKKAVRDDISDDHLAELQEKGKALKIEVD